MTKKNLLLILFAICLATVYVVWFTDWFRPATVRIYHTDREFRPRARRGNALPNLRFGISSVVKMTDLKVVMLAGYETNKDVLPVWHLISDSNSVPIKTFFYGEYIRGMRPAIKGSRPEELETNVPYRLFLTAGKITGVHDFTIK